MPDVADDRHLSLVRTISEMPDVLAALLAEHRDDGRGRCTGCRTAGYGTPGERWPCTPARLGHAAEQLARQKRAGTTARQPDATHGATQ